MYRKNVKSVKSFQFKKPDGTVLEQNVPGNINQSVLRHVDTSEYFIRTVTVSRDIAEKEFLEFTLAEQGTVGFLIPARALLSTSNPNNKNKFYAAYSLIAVAIICQNSWADDYSLTTNSSEDTSSISSQFDGNFFYAIIWKKKVGVTSADFDNDYFLALCRNGLILSPSRTSPIRSTNEQNAYSGTLTLKSNQTYPMYVRHIIVNLIPYTKDVFLTFFYIYQLVEHLMSLGFKGRYKDIKSSLDSESDMTITALKNYLDEFNAAIKEKTRINTVLSPSCVDSEIFSDVILDALTIDKTKMTFAEKIYQIRNVIFHDYPRIIDKENEVSNLIDKFLPYLLEKRLL